MSQNQQMVPLSEKVARVREMFAMRKQQMAATIPKFMTPERLMTLAMSAIQNNPKLMDCDQLSFVNSVIAAGRLGLEPDGLLGQAYLVPFKGKVQLIPGYRGLLKLARNSGQLSAIQAHEVYKGDEFEFSYGLDPVLRHKPSSEPQNEKDIIGFYAIAKLKSGEEQFDVMWRWQVEKIRDNSEGYKAFKKGWISTTPWDSNFAEMGKKTVLRRLLKMVPASIDVQTIIAADESAEAGRDQQFDITLDPPSDDDANAPSANGLDAIVDSSKGGKKLKGKGKSEDPEPEPVAPTDDGNPGSVPKDLFE